MKKSDVIAHFGSLTAVARALDITVGAVWQWGRIIPEISARRLHDKTNGELRFDEKLYRKSA